MNHYVQHEKMAVHEAELVVSKQDLLILFPPVAG